MATTKQTVILAFVVLGFWFTDGAVGFPTTPVPPPPPSEKPAHGAKVKNGSSDFVYLFNGNAILDYDAEQRRISLVGTDIFGGEQLGNTFKQNRTARWDFDLVFEEVKREVKDCLRNEFLGGSGNDILSGILNGDDEENPEDPRFRRRFQRVVEYTGNLNEGGTVTGTLRLDENATQAAGLTFVREADEPELNQFELNIGTPESAVSEAAADFPEETNVFGFTFTEGQLFSFQERQFVNNCSDGDERNVPPVSTDYIFGRFCHNTFDLGGEVACRRTDPRTGEIRETTGTVTGLVCGSAACP